MPGRRSLIKSALLAIGTIAFPGLPGVKAASSQYGIEGQIAPELKVNYWIDKNGQPTDFKLRYDLKVPMGHDPGGEDGYPATMADYRTGGTPWMILINPQREVVFNDFGINVEKAIDYLDKVSQA